MRREKRRGLNLTPIFSILILILSLLFSFIREASAQHLVGTYTTSAPEATMFFLNPGYLNPAFGSGALGMQSNPAGLHTVRGSRLSMAVGTSQSSTGRFSLNVVDESEIYDPVTLETEFELRESGGLGAIGFAHQTGNWVWGIAIMQARTGGVSLQAQGSVRLNTNFTLDTPITKKHYSELPVDEIPVTWHVNAQSDVRFWSTPAELYLSIQPILAGFSVQKGHFSFGGGLTWLRLLSSDDTGGIYSQADAKASITGIPQGTDPVTHQEWKGSVTAQADISDQPLLAQYNFSVSGDRFALKLGGMMNYKLLSLGISYTHGFKGTVNGSYNITTITTTGLPDEDLLSDIDLDLTLHPELHGQASLSLRDFKKDTLLTRDRGLFAIGGYHSFSMGLHFLIFGVFAGAEIPKSYPDIYSATLGIYTEFPIPKTPVRLNLGFISRSDGIMNNIDFGVPYRIVSHVGAGLALKLPTRQWFQFGQEDSWLRFGARSSLTSYALNVFESNVEEMKLAHIPSAFESIAWSLGLTVSY